MPGEVLHISSYIVLGEHSGEGLLLVALTNARWGLYLSGCLPHHSSIMAAGLWMLKGTAKQSPYKRTKPPRCANLLWQPLSVAAS